MVANRSSASISTLVIAPAWASSSRAPREIFGPVSVSSIQAVGARNLIHYRKSGPDVRRDSSESLRERSTCKAGTGSDRAKCTCLAPNRIGYGRVLDAIAAIHVSLRRFGGRGLSASLDRLAPSRASELRAVSPQGSQGLRRAVELDRSSSQISFYEVGAR
jgi:hypothetical protein